MEFPGEYRFRARGVGRRREDRQARDRVTQLSRLLKVGQVVVSEMDREKLLEIIMDQTNQILGTERSAAFLYDAGTEELWSIVATGMGGREIRIPADHGLVGLAMKEKSPVITNDPYGDPHFYREVDRASGFRTRNILCIPLLNRLQECIGVLEALNKESGDFTDDDIELFTPVAHYMAIALENSRLYEELKLLDKAKERVINHLSHELRTPLAVISGVLERISRKLKESNAMDLDGTIAMGQRSVSRLMEMQAKIEDVLNQRFFEEKQKLINIFEDALYFVKMMEGDAEISQKGLLGLIEERIESFYRVDDVRMERIALFGFLNELCDEAVGLMEGRELEIARSLEKNAVITMDRAILSKVCRGLLRNAIENSPDEGRIDVRTWNGKDGIRIDVCDYGVGISPENQKMIFGGFFHTQETDIYSSKKPYTFNAGGTGSDLLRMKVFSERLRFNLRFESKRCDFIPADRDVCPGRISLCRAISGRSECLSSGGSTFTVIFQPREVLRHP